MKYVFPSASPSSFWNEAGRNTGTYVSYYPLSADCVLRAHRGGWDLWDAGSEGVVRICRGPPQARLHGELRKSELIRAMGPVWRLQSGCEKIRSILESNPGILEETWGLLETTDDSEG